MGGTYLRPKAHDREALFRARSEDFQFRNPVGNEWTMREREPNLPSGKHGWQTLQRGIKPDLPGGVAGRAETYERMFGTQVGSMAKKGPL